MRTIAKHFNTEFTPKISTWTTEEIDGNVINKSEEVDGQPFKGLRQQGTGQFTNNPEVIQNTPGLTFSQAHIIFCDIDTEVAPETKLESEFGIDIVKAMQINRQGQNHYKELLVQFVGKEDVS